MLWPRVPSRAVGLGAPWDVDEVMDQRGRASELDVLGLGREAQRPAIHPQDMLAIVRQVDIVGLFGDQRPEGSVAWVAGSGASMGGGYPVRRLTADE